MRARLRIVGRCAPRRCSPDLPKRRRKSAAANPRFGGDLHLRWQRDQYSQDPRAWQRPDGSARPASASLVDPEDDLPSSTYGGDFETTAIPRYDSAKAAAGEPGLGLLATPTAALRRSPAGATRWRRTRPNRPRSTRPHRRGPRPGRRPARHPGPRPDACCGWRLGALLISHGLQKAFGWWGGPGLGGFETSLADLGFQHAGVLTYVAAGRPDRRRVCCWCSACSPRWPPPARWPTWSTRCSPGRRRHDEAGFASSSPTGTSTRSSLIVAAAALILTGPGRYGFDAGRGWARRPFVGSFVALLVGIGGGIGVWVLLNGANPLA